MRKAPDAVRLRVLSGDARDGVDAMSVELDATETVLLFGAPVAAIREKDGSVRLDMNRDDFRCAGSGEWVVYAEIADTKVAAPPSKAVALALRVMSRPVDDGLLVSESLILDRRAEVLAEAAKTAGEPCSQNKQKIENKNV